MKTANSSHTYSDFTACNNESNGKAIVELYTSRTFEHYDVLLRFALDGTAQQVRALPPIDKCEVLRMRLLGSRSELARMNGRQYVEYATSKGWYVTPPEYRTPLTLRSFKFGKDDATAELYDDGEATGVRLRFQFEDGRWKYDEHYSTPQWDALWRRAAREEGSSEDEFVVGELEFLYERDVPDSIWNPLGR